MTAVPGSPPRVGVCAHTFGGGVCSLCLVPTTLPTWASGDPERPAMQLDFGDRGEPGNADRTPIAFAGFVGGYRTAARPEVRPAPPASRWRLVRRWALDLLGRVFLGRPTLAEYLEYRRVARLPLCEAMTIANQSISASFFVSRARAGLWPKRRYA